MKLLLLISLLIAPFLRAEPISLQNAGASFTQTGFSAAGTDDLVFLQVAAGQTLARGLTVAQTARTALSQAISDRTELPRRFTEDPDVLRGLLESADTLDAFASGLAPAEDDENYFITAKGRLPLPVIGSVLLAVVARCTETRSGPVVRPVATAAVARLAPITTSSSPSLRT